MPINPLYQFIDQVPGAEGAMPVDDRNKVLDFLRKDAERQGMGSNYQLELQNAQEQMNTLNATPSKPVAPRPMPRPAPRPQVPMGQIQAAEMPESPEMEAPELQSPQAPEPREFQGISGMASQEEVPMSRPAQVGGQMEVPEPQPIQNQPFSLPEAQVTGTMEEPDLGAYGETTLAKKAQEQGWDPRRLYAAMSQFAGEFGNIQGRATESTAMPYYEGMIKDERANSLVRQKEMEAQREHDMKLKEMELRYRPKPAAPDAELKMELLQAQRDKLKNETQVSQEMNDPNSPRSKALKFGLEKYVQKTMNIPQFKAHPDLTGADVYKWLGSMQYAMGQQNMITREQLDAIGRTGEQDWRSQEAEKNRQFQAQQNALNRGAAAQRQKEQIAARPVKGGAGGEMAGEPVVQVPGWQKTQNVPVRETELSQFRARTAKVPGIVRKINQLKALIQQHGAVENTMGQAGQDMASLANDIKLDLKGPEFKALGVLAGPDMAILEALVPNTEPGFNINALRSSKSVIGNLSNLAQRLEADLDDAGRSIGFSRGAQQSAQPQQLGPRGRPVWKP